MTPGFAFIGIMVIVAVIEVTTVYGIFKSMFKGA